MNKKPIYEELEQRLKELEKEALTRKQAEEATLESEEELKAIFDSVRDGIALLDMTGKVIKANKRIVEVGGYSEEEIVGRRIKLLKMFAPSSIAKMLPAFAKIISGQKVLPIEVETYTKNGEKLVIEIHGSLFKKRGKAMGIVAVMRDITERKQVEEALKESENRFRTLVEKSVEAIFLVNFDMEIVFWNRAAEEMIGLRTTPTKKITLSDVLTPDSLNIAMANVARASKNGTTRPRPYELTIRKPDGTLADLEVFIGLVEYDGKPHMLGTGRDITERKRMEEALRRREAILRAVGSAAERFLRATSLEQGKIQEILAQLGQATKISRVYVFENHIGEDGTHLTSQCYEWVGPGIMSQIDNPDGQNFRWQAGGMGRWEKTLRQGQIIQGHVREFPASEKRILAPQDIQSIVVVPIFVEEKWWGFIGVDECQKEREWSAAEIDALKIVGAILGALIERKQAEQALSKREKELGLITDNIPGLISYVDADGYYRFVNERYEKWFDLSREDIIGKHYGSVLGDDTHRLIKSYVQAVLSGRRVHYQEALPYKRGGARWVDADYVPDIDDKGKVKGFFALVTDITERKQAEDALRESEEKYRSLVESTEDSIYLLDRNCKYLFMNKKHLSRLGLAAEKAKSRTYAELYSENDTKDFVGKVEKVFQTGKSLYYEYRSQRDGRYFVRTLSPVKKTDGSTKAVTVISKDINELKQAEEALQDSEEKYRLLIENQTDLVVKFDTKGRFLFASPSYCKMFGKEEEELMGKKFMHMVHEDYQEITSKSIEDLYRPPYTSYVEQHVLAKDEWRWVAWATKAVLDEKNNVIAIVSSGRDITEKKRTEGELIRSEKKLRDLSTYLQSAREQERTSIAREIHDELAQALTALKMDISWLEKRLPKDQKTLLEKTRAMTKLTDMTIKTVKRVSTELRPGLLDDLGLVAAIEWQAGEFQDRTGITCELIVDPEDIFLDRDRSTTIFRIFQETLTNIARHAKAKMVTASLKEKAGNLELKVKDDGKGITEKQISNPKSFGLIGMRERVHPWGGEVKISGIPDKGTTVEVRIPVEEISRKGAKDAK